MPSGRRRSEACPTRLQRLIAKKCRRAGAAYCSRQIGSKTCHNESRRATTPIFSTLRSPVVADRRIASATLWGWLRRRNCDVSGNSARQRADWRSVFTSKIPSPNESDTIWLEQAASCVRLWYDIRNLETSNDDNYR